MALTTTLLYGRGNMRLIKTFKADGTVEPYPMAKNFTSEVVEFPLTVDGLQARLEALRNAARRGGCLLKGELKEPLQDEPRAGKGITSKANRSLILDIDKLPVDFKKVNGWEAAYEKDTGHKHGEGLFQAVQHSIGREQLRVLAEHIVSLFPALANTSYYIHASSSMGMRKDSISMHIEFILDEPITPDVQKDWLRYCNLNITTFNQNIQLSKNGASLLWPLDISVADNTKLIFIAHPHFEDAKMNPIKDEDRILLVLKENIIASSREMRSIPAQQIRDLANSKVADMRKNLGFASKKFKTKFIGMGDSRVEVLLNPDAMSLTIIDDAGDFVHANVNDGDSNSYYWPKSNPTLVYNFKGEPAFRMEDACPEFYLEVLQKYEEFLGKEEGRQVFVRRNFEEGGALYGIECDTVNNKMLQLGVIANAQAASDYLLHNGYMPPDNYAYAIIEYNPKNEAIYSRIEKNGQSIEVFNSYMESDTWRAARFEQGEEINYDNCTEKLKAMAPATAYLLNHVFAGAQGEIRHFLNWIAAAINSKEKLGTTWLLQGTQGTGKGIMWEMLIVPLFGESNIKKMTVSELEDKFDANLGHKTMILVDEFRHSDAVGSKKLENKLKLMATEASYSLRGMHVEYKEVANSFQMIFFSNNNDAVRIQANDRRWNIAPRQETPLWAALDKTDKQAAFRRIQNMRDKIAEERGKFANFLRSFQFDMAMARIALDNPAKRLMTMASRTKAEDFAAALEEGDFEFFVSAAAGVPRYDMATVQQTRNALMRMAVGIRDKRTSEVPVLADDLLTFYNVVVSGKPEPLSSMDKFLRRTTRFACIRRGDDNVLDIPFKCNDVTIAAILKDKQNGRPEQPYQPNPSGLTGTDDGADN